MSTSYQYDAVVIGSGPNGLAAAITLARADRSVIVFEAKGTLGGGSRSKELTLPGFVHDVCSAIHPLGIASPFMRSVPLAEYGLEWIYSPAQVAHPFDDGSAAVLYASIAETIATLGSDATAYQRHVAPLVAQWDTITEAFLGPLRPQAMIRHPFALASFGLAAIRSARSLAEAWFTETHARALFGGLSAHSMLSLEQPPSAAFGLVLCLAGHAGGWPFPRGGSQNIVNALAGYLRSLGGQIVTGVEVTSLEMMPSARSYLFDVTPHQLIAIASNHLPTWYQQQLQRYRYGPGAFKLDYALDGPIPWNAQQCTRAATVHLGSTFSEIAESEWAASHGADPEKPYVLIAQQSLFDPTRVPEGKQTAWAYCHVSNGSTFDMTERIEAQIERFAPGFRDRILARHVMTPQDLEHYNANYIGGDINGGVQDLLQLFTRPTIRIPPYTTPNRRIFLCSSSTPPGGGVHGMCGYYAALAAIHTSDTRHPGFGTSRIAPRH